MPKEKPPEIHDVYCEDCGTYLLGAPLNSLTYCAACNLWNKTKIKNEDESNQNQGVDINARVTE